MSARPKLHVHEVRSQSDFVFSKNIISPSKPKTDLLVFVQKFKKAISSRFAMIDVNKNHKIAK